MSKGGRKAQATRRPVPPAAPAAGERAPSTAAASIAIGLIPTAAFAVLVLATLHEWYLPFADSSREVAVPFRLLHGDVLYRDVVFQYGPLPPYLDALALGLLGESLSSLLVVRILVSLLGIEALRRMVGSISGPGLLASCVTTAVVTATAFLRNGGDWAFPYSVAALEGTAGTWLAVVVALASSRLRTSLAAGAVAGLAASTKPEFAIVAPLSLVAALAFRRPRREVAGALAVALAPAVLAWGLPPLLLGVDVLRERGYLIYLDTPPAWRRLYSGLFWGGESPGTFFGARTAAAWGISGAFLAAGALAVRLGARLGRAGLVLAFAAGAAAVAIPSNREIQLLVPASVAVTLALGLRLARTWRTPPDASGAGAVGRLAPVVLVPAARQPFSLMAGAPYSAFSAPAALAVSLSLLASWIGTPAHASAFLLGLSVAQATDRVREHREGPREIVRMARGTVSLYDCEARVVKDLVAWLERSTPPRSTIAGLPYPGFVLFLADRRSAFADDALDPGSLGREAEARAVSALGNSRIAAGFLVNRPFGEFGLAYFGQGFGEELLRAYRERLRPVGAVGGDSPGCPPTALVDTAALYLPRDDGPAVASSGATPTSR